MQRAAAANKRAGNLAALFRSRRTARQPEPQDIRERLAALAEPEGIKLLNALYARLDRLEDGVDAERFRVAFKDRRENIRRLGQWFLKETSDARRTYRPTLMALPLIDDGGARSMSALVDRVLVYLAAELESREAEREVTIGEMATAFEAPVEQVADALAYLFEGPMSAGRSSGFPAGAEWYVIPNEQTLDWPDLDALLRQMAEWAENATTRSYLLPSEGELLAARTPEAESPLSRLAGNWKRIVAWIGGIVAFLASLVAVIEFFIGA
jgi:hypothetical protein